MRHLRSPRQQQIERGHPHRDAVRDLLEHRRPRRIGGSRRRSPGRGSSGRGASPCYPRAAGRTARRRAPSVREYSPLVGEIRGVHALELDAQHHDDVGRLGDAPRRGRSRPAPASADMSTGTQGRRRDERRPRRRASSSSHTFDRATRECRMSPTIVTVHAVEVASADCRAVQALADRERVEQRLRRMLVRAVAGVDDAGVDPAARRRGCAGRRTRRGG